MQLFDKWQSVTEAYDFFHEEANHLGRVVADFLKDFSETNDSFNNAISKIFNGNCDGYSILVKEAQSVEDYPLVFKFKNANNNHIWEFIVSDKQEENQTMHEFIEKCESKGKTHLLEKQIERAEQCLSLIRDKLENFDAYLIIQYLIVELLKNGGFDD
ncbi:hypothetical protein [Helicobacter pylori]|uniref:hypothetical protein n=1 Tax=Helicobacter pylori TaxID=210 RepID=UPI001F1FE984|nr:hypothetical protein [Helicobacter pylori]